MRCRCPVWRHEDGSLVVQQQQCRCPVWTSAAAGKSKVLPLCAYTVCPGRVFSRDVYVKYKFSLAILLRRAGSICLGGRLTRFCGSRTFPAFRGSVGVRGGSLSAYGASQV